MPSRPCHRLVEPVAVVSDPLQPLDILVTVRVKLCRAVRLPQSIRHKLTVFLALLLAHMLIPILRRNGDGHLVHVTDEDTVALATNRIGHARTDYRCGRDRSCSWR